VGGQSITLEASAGSYLLTGPNTTTMTVDAAPRRRKRPILYLTRRSATSRGATLRRTSTRTFFGNR
jgi:hypothetical protein